ncbi:hypothetical protein [Actinopolyspora halophila]|uniref:hypothetical protein n=1 Tax=Actinopolyspora halophila TaxID=1850 RepID=UPI000377EEFD|nr:hypothetical protein [Actinopolyspora halophila]
MSVAKGEASGFSGASAALGAISEENSWLQQQISGGGLSMEPAAADSAAKVYEEKAGKVDLLVVEAGRLQQVPGLGDYPSGRQLANKFSQKAKNGSTGAADLLTQFAEELRRKADLFRQAKEKYIATDEQISSDLNRGSQQ